MHIVEIRGPGIELYSQEGKLFTGVPHNWTKHEVSVLLRARNDLLVWTDAGDIISSADINGYDFVSGAILTSDGKEL